MTQQEIIDYCLIKRGAYTDFPFGPEFLILRIRAKSQQGGGRTFAQIFELKGEPKATFSCSREGGLFYREMFPDKVVRGWHCPPVQQPYFNTITVDGTIPDDVIRKMVDHAYETVVAKMPKYIQKELQAEE